MAGTGLETCSAGLVVVGESLEFPDAFID
jgi:hypothetical protein